MTRSDQKSAQSKDRTALSYEAFLNLAQVLGCLGVEPRNDLGRPLFDGIAPAEAGAMARERGFRLLGLSEVYPFNDWSGESASAIQALIDGASLPFPESVRASVGLHTVPRKQEC
ncbi:hypothetical protein ABFT80_26500 [Mesorhizobium sp. SB112]|uniref:hypothetical protein n=1 Tax=Mesorhizobium sp. SB112 TaxID=3151853 RepID=UPI0032656AF3